MATGYLRGAAPGLTRLAQQIAGGQGSYQGGYDNELGLQSKLALSMAQAQAAQASADESTAKAEGYRAKTDSLGRRPQLYEEQAALASGTDVPLVRAIRQQLATGQAPQVPMGPPTEGGELGVGSQQFDPAQRSAVVQQLQRLLPVLANNDDFKVDDWQKAQSGYREQDLRDQVLSGRLDPKTLALSQRAAKGDAAYAPAEYGVTDLFSGTVDSSGPAAVRFGGYRDSTTAAQKANAAQSYASADNSRASAEATRAGGKTGGLQVLTGEDGTVTIVDKAAGTSRPVIGADGKPVMGKNKDSASTVAKVNDAREALSLIDMADELVTNSTGSLAGAWWDKTLASVGKSTTGGTNAARLKALEGMLVSKMPKMSGPQSDKDVALYRQMAANIGDETIPNEQKQAALDTVRDIQERYAGLEPGSTKRKRGASGDFGPPDPKGRPPLSSFNK